MYVPINRYSEERPEMSAQHTAELKQGPSGVRAECSCGWGGPPHYTDEQAYTEWKQHADPVDNALVDSRMAKVEDEPGPRVGDYVRFADGELRRISYHWQDDEGWDGGVQTSKGGSFYLGEHGCSFSGSLFGSVPTDTLELTDERKAGPVWVFHHNMHQAHNGVTFQRDFRVYNCDREATR